MTVQNLTLLTSENRRDSEKAPITIPLCQITTSKNQPRRYFDREAIDSLVESVRRNGVLQPILVRPVGERFELVAGERRYRAALEAGLTEIPAVVRQMSDIKAVQCALTENLQRENLNPVEEAEGILQLLAFRLERSREEVIALLNKMSKVRRGLADNVIRPEERQTIDEIFATLGRFTPESFRVNRLPLLNLPSDILEALRAGRIEYTKAKEIAKLSQEETQKQLLKEVIAKRLSLKQIKKCIKNTKTHSEKEELKKRLKSTYTMINKSSIWNNHEKSKKLDYLLAEIEKLFQESY